MDVMILKYVFFVWVVLQLATTLTDLINNEKATNLLNKYGCFKCVTFWITLILTMDVFIASMNAFVAYMIDKYLNTVEL